MLNIDPQSLVFRDVRLNQAYTSSFCLSNPLTVTLEFNLRPSSSKYTITPNKVVLSPGQSIIISIRLFLQYHANYSKGVEGQHDVIMIKSPYFEQKIPLSFYLQPKESKAVSSSAMARSRSPSPTQSRDESPSYVLSNRQAVSGEIPDPIIELTRQVKSKDLKIKQLEELVRELESKYPSLQHIVNNRLEQEQAVFEEKSMKVLKILHKKDTQFSQLQEELSIANEKISSLLNDSEDDRRDYQANVQSDFSTLRTSGLPPSSALSANTTKNIIARLEKELELSNNRHEDDLREIHQLKQQLDKVLNTPPPPPPLQNRLSTEIQSLREQNLDQSEQIEVLVSELSKLRAEAGSSRNDISSSEQHVSDLQAELRHQQERYQDLKRAYETLEKIKVNSIDPKNESVSFQSIVPESKFPNSLEIESNVEGGFSTSTHFHAHSQSRRNSDAYINQGTSLLRDRTIQLELYQERAEAAEASLEKIRDQLKGITERESDQKIKIANLEASNKSKELEIAQYVEKVKSLQDSHNAAVAQLEDRDFQLLHSKKRAESTQDAQRINDANSWWSYVWHESKKMSNYGVSSNALINSDVQVTKFKEIIRQQAIELANVRQDLLGKKLINQREIDGLKDQLIASEKHILNLNQQLRSLKSEREIKISEMANTIRLLSGRSDLHAATLNSRQELEAEKLTSHHLKSEIESYKSIVDSQQLQIASLRKDVTLLKATSESIEVFSTINNLPGVDPATAIEVMSGNIVHLQLELAKAKATAAHAQNLADSLHKSIKFPSTASATSSTPQTVSQQPPPKKKTVVFADFDDNPHHTHATSQASSVSEEKESNEPSSPHQFPSHASSNQLSLNLPPLNLFDVSQQSSGGVTPISGVPKVTTQQLMDNLDAALLAQKVLLQDSTIASLQAQLIHQQNLLLQVEHDREIDRDIHEQNDRINLESQKQQYILLQEAYKGIKEELEVARDKSLKAEKKCVELEQTVIQQDLYQKALSEADLSSLNINTKEINTFQSQSKDISTLSEELDSTKHLLRERTTQLKVLMETMDSLQLAGISHSNQLQLQHAESSHSSPGAWATQALVKRVVELSAELASANASSSLEERRAHQLEVELKRRTREINDLKASSKKDVENIVKMKQHLVAMTAQVRDAEHQLLTEQRSLQQENQKLYDQLKDEEMSSASLKCRVDELEQQVKILEQEDSSETNEFKNWLNQVIFSEKPLSLKGSSDTQQASDLSRQPDHSPTQTDVRDLVITLLKEWRSDGNNPSSLTTPELVTTITNPMGHPIDSTEQKFLAKVTDLVLAANEKCLAAISSQQTLLQRQSIIEQQLSVISSRLQSSLKHLYRSRRRAKVLKHSLASGQHLQALQQTKLMQMLRTALQSERSKRQSALADLASVRQQLKLIEVNRVSETSQMQLLQAKVVELEISKSVGPSLVRTTASLSSLDNHIKESETLMQKWFHVELPRLVTGLPITEDAVPVTDSAGGQIFSRLTRDLGLDKTYALSQALCASKAVNATTELKLASVLEKYSLLQDQYLLLEGVVSRWKQEIEYVHRIREGAYSQSHSGDVPSQIESIQSVIQKNVEEPLNEIPNTKSLQDKVLESEEEIIELKGRLEFASSRLDQQNIVIQDLLQDEEEFKTLASDQLAKAKVELTEEYSEKLNSLREEYEFKIKSLQDLHLQEQQALANEMTELEKIVSDSKLSSATVIEPVRSSISKTETSVQTVERKNKSRKTQFRDDDYPYESSGYDTSNDEDEDKNTKAIIKKPKRKANNTSRPKSPEKDIDIESRNQKLSHLQNLLEIEQQRSRQVRAENEELQQLLSFQRQLLEQQSTSAMQTTPRARDEEAIVHSYPVDEESVLGENTSEWPVVERLLDDVINSLQLALQRPVTQATKHLIEESAKNSLRVHVLSYKQRQSQAKETETKARGTSTVPPPTVIDRGDNTVDDSSSNSSAKLKTSIQTLASRVRDLEKQLSLSDQSQKDTQVSERHLFLLRDLRVRVAEMEQQQQQVVDEMAKQQRRAEAAVKKAERKAEEAIIAAEKSSNEKLAILSSEKSTLIIENRTLREQHELFLKSQETQIKEIRSRYELSLSQAQEALEIQTKALKEELARVQSLLQKQTASTIVPSEHTAIVDEVIRLRQLTKEASRELELSRDQQRDQQKIYRRQIEELTENFHRSRRSQDEIIQSLEKQLDEATRMISSKAPFKSNDTNKPFSDNDMRKYSNFDEEGEPAERLRRLEYMYRAKTAELEAVMRTLTKSASETSYTAMAEGYSDVLPTGEKQSTGSGNSWDINREAFIAKINEAEKEINALNASLTAEKRTSEALRSQVQTLQQQVDRMMKLPIDSLAPSQTKNTQNQDNEPAPPTSRSETLNASERPSNVPVSSSNSNASKLTPPVNLKEILSSVETFLHSTSHELVPPTIAVSPQDNESMTGATAATARAVATALAVQAATATEKIKVFSKKANDIRRHARAEITRLKDLLSQAHETSKDEVTRLEGLVLELKQQISTQRDDSVRKAKLIASLKSARAADSAAMLHLQNENKDAEETIKRLTRSVAAKDSLVKDIRAKNQLLEDAVEKAASQTATVPTSSEYSNIPFAELKNKLRSAEQERVRMRQRTIALKDKVVELEEENKLVKQELDAMKQRGDRLDGLRAIIAKKDLFIKQLKEEVELLTSENSQFKAKVEDKRFGAEKQIRELNSDVENSRKIISNLERENQLLSIRLAAMSQALEAANSSIRRDKVPTKLQSSSTDSSFPAEALPAPLSGNAQDLSDVMHALGMTSGPSSGSNSLGGSPGAAVENKTSANIGAASALEQRLKALVRAALDTKPSDSGK